MKKAFLILFLMTISVVAFAQRGQGMRGGFENTTPEDRAKKETERLTNELSLTSDQVTQISAINLKYEQILQEKYNQNKNNQNPQAFFQGMREVRDQKMTELKTVLTQEQIVKLDQMNQRFPGMENRQGDRRNNGGRNRN